MNRITKRMTLLLSFLLCLLMLVACVPEDAKPTVPPADTPPSQRVEPDVEKKDYNGSFNVLHYTTSNHEWANPWDEIVPASGMENRPGDLIGSEIFDRAACWNSDVNPDAPEFANGGAVFTIDTIKQSTKLSEMRYKYGVLPIPMLNEEQTQYYSLVSGDHDSMFAVIGTNVENRQLIGAALELMGYYSYYEINNDFYDVAIQNRGTRDEKSKRMLQIIFQTRTYDMGLVYDPYGNTTVAIRIDDPQFDTVNMQWIGLASKREDTVRELRELIKKYN